MDKDNVYKNGQKISELNGGILTHYYKSGNKKAEGKFINEKFEGKWLFYSEAGAVIQEGNFVGNQKHGDWIRYNEKGEITHHEVFQNGKKLKGNPNMAKKTDKDPRAGEKETKKKPIERFCSFCNKSSKFAYCMIAGPNNISICDECVAVCVHILIKEGSQISFQPQHPPVPPPVKRKRKGTPNA